MKMNRLIPMLPVKSVTASIEFYKNVVEYDRQVRMNGLDVPDLDETFYGMTEFRLDDPDGNRLWIGQNTTAVAQPS
jgi:hypothetical protein